MKKVGYLKKAIIGWTLNIFYDISKFRIILNRSLMLIYNVSAYALKRSR